MSGSLVTGISRGLDRTLGRSRNPLFEQALFGPDQPVIPISDGSFGHPATDDHIIIVAGYLSPHLPRIGEKRLKIGIQIPHSDSARASIPDLIRKCQLA